MTPEQQRIAIADSMGVTTHEKHQWDERDDRRYFVCLRCDEVVNFREYSKGIGETNSRCSGTEHDYPNCLDSMHEAELNGLKNINHLVEYLDQLDKVCVPTHICPTTHAQAVIMATARQRAEAYLRTIGKWIE